MERNGLQIANDIMTQHKNKRKKDPMSIFLRKDKSKTSNNNKSLLKLNEVSKHKTGNSKGNRKR
jgi:hypothetical protein